MGMDTDETLKWVGYLLGANFLLSLFTAGFGSAGHTAVTISPFVYLGLLLLLFALVRYINHRS